MKKGIALILALSMLCAAFGTLAEEEKLEPLFATVGDALEAAGESPVAGGEEEYYAVVTEKDGKYYRSVADMDDRAKELQSAIWNADVDHIEAAFAASNEYIKTLPIAYSEMFTAAPMTQAELDALVGKTLGELREMGYEESECGSDVDESGNAIIAYVMRTGLFEYTFVVDADFDTYEKAQAGELNDGDFVVTGVKFRGIRGDACLKQYRLDGTVDEQEDPFAAFTELSQLVGDMIEKVKNGEEVDVEEFFNGLKELYPDLVEIIDTYFELFKAYGAEQLAGLLNPTE